MIYSLAKIGSQEEGIRQLARMCGEKAALKRLEKQMKPIFSWIESAKREGDDADLLEVDKIAATVMKELLPRTRCSGIARILPEAPCEARPSKIHGMGVFATRDIEPYTFITMYPCDGIGCILEGMGGYHAWNYGWCPEDNAFRSRYSQELPGPPGTWQVDVVGNPDLHDDPHFLGHMINDAAVCKKASHIGVYRAVVQKKSNCMFSPDLCAHFSIKAIAAGEEILSCYGADYWLACAKEEEKAAAAFAYNLNELD